jgi:hypothetical protein
MVHIIRMKKCSEIAANLGEEIRGHHLLGTITGGIPHD